MFGLSRHWEFLLLQWTGIFVVYTLRVNMSVAASAMEEELNWDETQKGYVLSAFYWGYMTGQIPTAVALQKGWIKGTTIFGISVFVPSLLTILVPMASRFSYPLALAIRCAIGFVESASFPTAFHFYRKWYPESERTVMVSTFMSSSYFGEIVGFLMSGALLEAFGWSWVFYSFGMMGIVWYPVWLVYAYENPRDHPKITKAELDYIVKGKYTCSDDGEEAGFVTLDGNNAGFRNLNITNNDNNSSYASGLDSFIDYNLVEPLVLKGKSDKEDDEEGSDASPIHTQNKKNSTEDHFRAQREISRAHYVPVSRVPWGAMLRNPVMSMIMLNAWCIGWLLFTLLSEMPSYLISDKMGFSIGEAGLLSTMPFGALFITAVCSGHFLKWGETNFSWTKWQQRTISQFAWVIIAPLFLVCCMFLGYEQRWLVYALLCGATGLLGFNATGVALFYLDIFPRFSGIVNTIGNTLSAGAGILGPVVASDLLVRYGEAGWDYLFLLTLAMSITAFAAWLVFGTTEIDPVLNSPVVSHIPVINA